MKTAAIAATAILALLVAGVAATAYAYQFPGLSMGQANPTAVAASHAGRSNQGNNGRGEGHSRAGNPLNLTVGETLSLTGLTGRYASLTNSSLRGNATGTIVVQVTSAFKQGYLLTISSGTITLGAVNYTVTGGMVELNPSGQAGSGTGSTSSSGQFLIHLNIHGNSTSPSGRAVLDFKAGGSEYLVSLGTPNPGVNDSD